MPTTKVSEKDSQKNFILKDGDNSNTQEDGRGSDVVAQTSTQSVESSEKNAEQHPETFECLTKCTEWYLVAQVANS